MHLVFVSDVHNKVKEFLDIVSYCEQKYGKNNYKLYQLGDFSDEDGWKKLPKLSDNISLIHGNHDINYKNHYNYIGEYGYCFSFNLFWISGAETPYEVQDKSKYNPEEQMSPNKLKMATKLFWQFRPKIVISHDFPNEVREKYFNCHKHSNTSCALQDMFNLCRPKLWVGGHHHKDLDIIINGTRFICQEKLKYFEINNEDITNLTI